MLIGDLDLKQGIIELVELLAGCMLPAGFRDAPFEDRDEHLEFLRERKLPTLIKDSIAVIQLAQIPIVDIDALVSHPLEHHVLLVLELAKDHGEKGEELGKSEHVHVLRHVVNVHLVLITGQIIRVEDVYDLEDEYAECLGVDPLPFDLVPLILGEHLLLCLQLEPDLVQRLVDLEEVIHGEIEGKELLAVGLYVVALVEDNHRVLQV